MDDNQVLLHLRRKYSKDETVAALSKKLSMAEVEIGKLKSEIDHLNDELLKLNKQSDRDVKIEAKKSHLYQVKSKQLKAYKKEISNLRKRNSELVLEIVNLRSLRPSVE